MMLTTAFRTLCLGATLVAAQRGRDRDDKCWTCEQSSGCFECLGISDNGDGTAMIELDFSDCKDADTIGWACCTGSMGPDDEFNSGACEVPPSGCFGKKNRSRDPDGGSVKCEGVSTMFLLVPSDATSVVINTHDGRTGNDASPAVGADPICAGREYQGGRCAARDNSVTAHCLETIDLSTCPTMDSLPMTAVPTPSPSVSSEFPSDVPSSMMSGESDLPSVVPVPDESEEE
ncbi:hypothetical protein FisN_27Lh100 [Fistulifera solaris]|uniref:Uncharacterized protein n=1 Tax=Fistulifera solaris TaxID=1519565 RepID=A0A1Z5KAV0_FISSO|nr:hypothetical protein FisN_27Lh100 [Fistulifera solaris]|eukprot:GAX23326.1 hypothetical protein FisN_27Lh100 [Fistulifera solaris]